MIPVSDRDRARWKASLGRLSDAELVATTLRLAALARVASIVAVNRGLDPAAAVTSPVPAFRPGRSGGLALADPTPPSRPTLRLFRGGEQEHPTFDRGGAA
jgi:hypothetical protein